MDNIISELFGYDTHDSKVNWKVVICQQTCPFVDKRCYKVRKSSPEISIGTCSVLYGSSPEPIIICPNRLLERRQIFTDCLHLLTQHEPGNELHIVPEVSIPGGSVDYFLVSVRLGKVVDFAGIELQTLDTTGTLWPERQRTLRALGVSRVDSEENSNKPFGMNWKMTAKTILVQIHHKIQTFEYINKKLALIIQDKLLYYMSREFKFDHMQPKPLIGDSVHLHVYCIAREQPNSFHIRMVDRLSTDAAGISLCLGLQAEARIELDQIITILQSKISDITRFTPV